MITPETAKKLLEALRDLLAFTEEASGGAGQACWDARAAIKQAEEEIND